MNILQKVTAIRKKIGIIGAGPSGLCTAMRSAQCGHDVLVFEQASSLGGTWIYSPEVDAHSSLYEGLM